MTPAQQFLVLQAQVRKAKESRVQFWEERWPGESSWHTATLAVLVIGVALGISNESFLQMFSAVALAVSMKVWYFRRAKEINCRFAEKYSEEARLLQELANSAQD